MMYSTLSKVNVIDGQHVCIECIWKVFTAFSYVTPSLHNGWMDGLRLLKNQELRNHMHILQVLTAFRWPEATPLIGCALGVVVLLEDEPSSPL